MNVHMPASTATDQRLWAPEDVKEAYAAALVIIERTGALDRPRLAKSAFHHTYTAEDLKGHSDRFDRNGRLMPRRETKVRIRYSAEQIEWATFVLCGGAFHGSGRLEPWTSGIIGKSVTRASFEAWGHQVAGRRLGGKNRPMSEVAAALGLSLRTFNRYVTGAAEQIAVALNRAQVAPWNG